MKNQKMREKYLLVATFQIVRNLPDRNMLREKVAVKNAGVCKTKFERWKEEKLAMWTEFNRKDKHAIKAAINYLKMEVNRIYGTRVRDVVISLDEELKEDATWQKEINVLLDASNVPQPIS
jgi:hypothetical protein